MCGSKSWDMEPSNPFETKELSTRHKSTGFGACNVVFLAFPLYPPFHSSFWNDKYIFLYIGNLQFDFFFNLKVIMGKELP